MEILAISVGIGLVVGLLYTELFGIAPAGLIVPGYLALYLTEPRTLAATLAVALATFGVVRLLSTFLLLHGRRRTALMILLGYLLGMLTDQWSGAWGQPLDTIGLIIPGLIAMWMDRQTVPQTLSSLFLVAFTVRLVLILTVGTELAS
ncbi:MAG: poly-gamma-glutamate biosynthesis protein PgsC [Deltaproteobacteria bacterium]|jgi:poly-gamma-glutamate biosynthesis protein PgsC/CapC|nr:poly-gamma-glutamate biosynthesis protein PgsC [Deltaproteobacteria bacterium]MBW2534805.1 poly-gamma-glutamate biosynthesis protein PgsC [Deltaproteobacteria bacterium]